jgi:hypothetical protein
MSIKAVADGKGPLGEAATRVPLRKNCIQFIVFSGIVTSVTAEQISEKYT